MLNPAEESTLAAHVKISFLYLVDLFLECCREDVGYGLDDWLLCFRDREFRYVFFARLLLFIVR